MRDVEGMKLRIEALRREKNAVIVAHNYQWPEVQDVADFVGDSLELARTTVAVPQRTIIFCGVHFMAESSAILNPDKTVYLAELTAGCPMANMITVDDLRVWKEKYPDAAVVCYVNSSAAVKAESDICCTSANAVKVVESLSAPRVLFVPDRNLGHYISRKTSKEMILYPGFCVTHQRVKPEHVVAAKEMHPEAVVVVHPECRPEVIDMADQVLSTSGMLRFVTSSPAKKFLIGTEEGLIYRMRQANPDKEFYTITSALMCPNMKKTTLESVVTSLELDRYRVTVAEDMAAKAKRALDRMLAVT